MAGEFPQEVNPEMEDDVQKYLGSTLRISSREGCEARKIGQRNFWAAAKPQKKPRLSKSQDDGAEWPLLKQTGLSLSISVVTLRKIAQPWSTRLSSAKGSC